MSTNTHNISALDAKLAWRNGYVQAQNGEFPCSNPFGNKMLRAIWLKGYMTWQVQRLRGETQFGKVVL